MITFDTFYTIQRVSGLSQDDKPMGMKPGSIFMELDTGKTFIFDSETWHEQPRGGGSGVQPELQYMDKVNPTGTGAFSLNRQADTTVGVYSFAEGSETTASGSYSHAEGSETIASGESSHAEGYMTTASGITSHAEGSETTASGEASHAEGFSATASGSYSHAEGYMTTASGNYSHVEGKCNIDDASNKYAHIVGNGTSETSRSNAHTLDWSGNAWFAGTVEGKDLILPSSTEGSTKKFKITVDDSGTITATEVI